MDRTIMTLPAENRELYEISAGYRYPLAIFNGKVEVIGKRTSLAGLHFEDSNPISGELVFEITDSELVRKFVEEKRTQ